MLKEKPKPLPAVFKPDCETAIISIAESTSGNSLNAISLIFHVNLSNSLSLVRLQVSGPAGPVTSVRRHSHSCVCLRPPPVREQVVKLGHSPLVEDLLVAGADPDIPDPACGLTVTHDAARDGFMDTVRVLVKHRAKVNLVDVKGNLPLHLAAREGHLEVVRLLTEHTDDCQAPNGAGYTARQLALQREKMDVVQYIDEYLSSREYCYLQIQENSRDISKRTKSAGVS